MGDGLLEGDRLRAGSPFRRFGGIPMKDDGARSPRAEREVRRPGRITRRAEYLELSKSGRRVVSTHFVFLVARSPEPGLGRLGITVTKKIAGAVGRNRWKRLIREAFRLHSDLVPGGASVVVIVRRPESSFTLGDVVAEWRGVRTKLEAAVRKPSATEKVRPT